MTRPTLVEIRREAEDGLDPVDGLTAEEALARILVLISGSTVEQGYEARQIQALLRWSEGAGDRTTLEDQGLIARWVIGGQS